MREDTFPNVQDQNSTVSLIIGCTLQRKATSYNNKILYNTIVVVIVINIAYKITSFDIPIMERKLIEAYLNKHYYIGSENTDI